MEDLIQQGISAIKAGDKNTALKFFLSAIKQNPNNERAWQYMYNVSNTNQEKVYCLQQILRINPTNEKAMQLLQQLTGSRIVTEESTPLVNHPATFKPISATNNNPHNTDKPLAIFRSSPRSLLARYIIIAPIMMLVFLVTLFVPILLLVSVPLLLIVLGKLIWDYQLTQNTTYYLYRSHIKSTSYAFQLFGVRSNTINLAHLKQIQAFSNSFLDVWFFKCGKVRITVAGDYSDFEIENVEYPGQIRNTIENLLFGTPNTETDVSYAPEVAAKQSILRN